MSEKRGVVTILFLAALVSAAWQLFAFPGAGFGRYFESTAIARSLAAGRGFANPFGSLETGPSAHLAPVYPFILGGLIRVFGDTPAAGMAASFLCILAHALHAVLLIPVSKLLFHDSKPGVLAAGVAAVVPLIRVYPQGEAVFAAAASLLFCLTTERLGRLRLGPARQGGLAGLFCGLLLLLNPALLIVCIAWMGFLAFSNRIPRRAWAAMCLAFLAGTAAVCAPWAARNYYLFRSPVFVRDNFGLELYVSNADCSSPRLAENERNGCHAFLHPNRSTQEALLVRQMGEVNYNHSRMAVAADWIRRHPSGFRELTLSRIREFWFPTPESGAVYEYSLWVVTGLSFVGLIYLLLERNGAALFLVAVLGLYPAVYYLVQSSTRYRFPIVWVSLLPAAIAVLRLTRHAPSATISPNGRGTDLECDQDVRQCHGR